MTIEGYLFPETVQQGSESQVKDYVALLKPRVMSLVVFTGLAGIFLAPSSLHPFLCFVSILCIALGSGAAGAINMWYDRDIDAVMKRTKKRPIPSGKVRSSEALSFGVVLSIASVVVMGLATNWVAGALLASAILFYVFIYTIWLKRSTPQNIVIGGAAGSFPPMIGWASVTGDISVMSVVLFLIIFMWTPPHFWALALFKSEEYEKAGVPMLPVVAGDKVTRLQMLIYTVLLLPLTLVPYFIGFSGLVYVGVALVLGGVFLWHAVRVYLIADMTQDKSIRYARTMFAYSILYLFLLFLGLLVDTLF